jgi:hypothetical protein
MLHPQSAVLVEGGNAVCRFDIVRTAFGDYCLDEPKDGLLRRSLMPGRQRVLGLCLGQGQGGKGQDRAGPDETNKNDLPENISLLND